MTTRRGGLGLDRPSSIDLPRQEKKHREKQTIPLSYFFVLAPAAHAPQAMYEFADQAALDRAMSGDALKTLVDEFNRCWPEVKRTREVLVLAEEFGAG